MDEFPRGFVVSAGPAAPAIQAPPPEKCGLAKFHSRQKHALIESYFRVWTHNVKPGQDSTARPSLDIVDLFASFGWCRDEESGERWEGTAVRAAQCLKDYDSRWGKGLFLNSYHPDEEERKLQVAALEESLLAVGAKGRTWVRMCSAPAEQAAEAILPHVRADYPNLWVLDPYRMDDLPWTVVEKIIRHRGKPPGDPKKKPRKPELFITLMTWSLQKNVTPNPHVISKAIGLPEEEWRPRFQAYLDAGANHTEAITELYRDRLMEHYEKPPQMWPVEGTEGNLVYVMLFASDQDAGYHSMRQVASKYFETWKERSYKPKADQLKASRQFKRREEREDARAAEQGQKRTKLTDFF